MPRKSAISLAVTPPALPTERPAPPAAFDDTEATIWRAIAGGLPPVWLDGPSQEVLARAVAQAAVCQLLEAQLRSLRAQPAPDLEQLGTLAAQHASASKSLAQLLGALRATPRARMVPRGAARQMTTVPRVRPWEASEADDDG